MGERNSPAIYPGRNQPANPRNATGAPPPYDPTGDDPIDNAHPAGTSVRSGSSDHHNHPPSPHSSPYIVAPSIQVKPEFSTLTRTSDPTQPLTCIVTVELPSRRTHGHTPGPVIDHAYRAHTHASIMPGPSPSPRPDHHASQNLSDRSDVTVTTRNRPSSPDSLASTPYAYNATPAPSDIESPFSSITEDLRNRIIDWKGHPLPGLGPLQMFDLLSVRRDSLVREFYVYLFKEAIICVIEERKRSLGRLLSSASGSNAFGDSPVIQQAKGVLRLKGRIYIRHIKQVTETSIAGELSLTIDMEDERLESFILIFKDRSSLETWRAHIAELVASFHGPPRGAIADTDEFGVPPTSAGSKAQRMLSGSTGSDVTSQTDSLLAQGSSRSTLSSSTSHGSRLAHGKLPTHHENYNEPSPSPGLVSPHLSAGPSNSLPSLPHTPLDLILVVSLPPPTASQSTAALKHRVIKTAFDFIIANLGPKDRLSLVTFEVGLGGRVRKTPFLSPGRPQGHLRLVKFVEGISSRDDGVEDEFIVRTAKDEKTDVVTGVNHGLDVVLQRKSRNAISGMMLVSDAADSTRRAQMDLVLARAEAAK